MEGYMWLILVSMLGVGVLFGFVIGRSKGDVSAPKVRELEQNLHQANEEMQNYRTQVTQHFEKTATLFNQLTNDYREVYEHLANSSNQLCGTETAKIKSLTADKNVLEGQSEKADTPSAKSATAKSAATETKKPSKKEEAAAAQQDKPQDEEQSAKQAEGETAKSESGQAEKKGDGSAEAPGATVPPVKETVAGDETPRTIH